MSDIKFAEKDGSLKAIVQFDSYLEGMAFANAVAELAEQQNHHPNIMISYAKVEVETTTHDAGNTVTDKDWRLARAIEAIL